MKRAVTTNTAVKSSRHTLKDGLRQMGKDYQLYLLILPALAYIIIFCYIPMYGVQISFKDYQFTKGILGSNWVGMKHFKAFFTLPNVWQIIWNTFSISLYQLIAGFPLPIILAIMINEVHHTKFKKTVQMVTYAPYFISSVVLCGMVIMFLSKDRGLINHIIALFGGERKEFMMMPQCFKTIFVFSDFWQTTGWGTIIYLSALSAVDQQVVESAQIDGANRLQKIWHVDIPCILPTIVILLIMRSGSLLSVGYEKILLLQNSLNMDASDVISTYTYRVGIVGGKFSYSSAIGLFNSVINFVILVIVNFVAGKVGETSLW